MRHRHRSILNKTGAAALAALTLSACSDREDEVRTHVARLLYPGETLYFEQQLGCMVGVYAAHIGEVKSAVPIVGSVEEAFSRIGRGQAVAFDNPDFSPNMISEEIASKNLPAGVAVLAAGAGARSCMTVPVQQGYYNSLMRPEAVLILDLEDDALILLDRVTRLIYYVRGDL